MSTFDRYPRSASTPFNRLAPVLWPEPADPAIFGTVEVRADRLEEWIDLQRRISGEPVTASHAVVRALALVLRQHPRYNALVRRGRLARRRSVDVFLQFPREVPGTSGLREPGGFVIRDADARTVLDVARLAAENESHSAENDPWALLRRRATRWSPGLLGPAVRWARRLHYDWGLGTGWLGFPPDPFGSAIVVPLGTRGVQVAFAPLFPLARCPIVVVVGALEDRPVADRGALLIRRTLVLNATFDHRIIDGFAAADLARKVKLVLENPRSLETPEHYSGTLPDSDDSTELELPDPLSTEEAEASR